ncbi:hypothetical protein PHOOPHIGHTERS_51 [Serratia phage vB_SmaS_PhooPhighters]|nr:hypothetical protein PHOOPHIGHTERS_51 [Serratia phage vB_SmaS_PhooPhighters]
MRRIGSSTIERRTVTFYSGKNAVGAYCVIAKCTTRDNKRLSATGKSVSQAIDFLVSEIHRHEKMRAAK